MSFSHDFRGGHVAHAHTEGQPLEPHGRYTSQARLNPIATMREVCWAHCRAAQRASMRDRGFGQSCPRGHLFRTATNTGPLHPSGIRYFSNVTSAAVPDLDHELVDGASSVTTRRQGGASPRAHPLERLDEAIKPPANAGLGGTTVPGARLQGRADMLDRPGRGAGGRRGCLQSVGRIPRGAQENIDGKLVHVRSHSPGAAELTIRYAIAGR